MDDIDLDDENNENKNFEQIQNFNGEKISIITESDIKSSNLNNNFNKYSHGTSIYESKYINNKQTIIN